MTKASPKKPRPRSSTQTSRRRSVQKPAPSGISPVAPADLVASASIPKLDLLTNLLREPGGASIAELAEATGWQPHSVRGAMSGALKRRGLTVTSGVVDGVRRYRIGEPE